MKDVFNKVVDSGDRRQFSSGAVRDMQEGKGRFDLFPVEAMFRLARHFENGAVKYGDNNWRKGIPLKDFIDSAIRHLFKVLRGDEDEDHAAAAIWNVACYIETIQMIKDGKFTDDVISEIDCLPCGKKIINNKND